MKRMKSLIRSCLMYPHVRSLRQRGVRTGQNVRVFGRVHISKAPGSVIEFADNVVLNSNIRGNTLEARGPVIIKTLSRAARISVGKDSGMTSVTLSSASSIVIGERVLLGAGVLITDSDHHVVEPEQGRARRFLGLPKPRPGNCVLIGDDVFIGARSIVLKGVNIGSGSVIGAGSVVASDIPASVIAAGNPCRVIRPLGS